MHVHLGHRWSAAIRQLLETITGWWCNNHLEKYESQWEGLSHILWNIKKMFFPRGTPKPGWVAQRRQPGCKLDVQSVQCLPGSRRRFRQLGGQKTLNKIVLLRSNPNRQRAFKAAYPLRSRPHSCRGKLD